VIIASRHRRLSVAAAACAALVGTIAALHYSRLGLTLSHYDARGHLIVARRIVDSITPGWQQIGAVWLPLPHLINALPVQIDAFYRSGASGVAISVIAFAVAAGSVASIVSGLTGSMWGAAVGAAVLVINPNLLYLQATPMTEPLLLGLTTLAIACFLDWMARPSRNPAIVGVLFALACLTRYEAWPVTASALAIAAWALWRDDESAGRALGRVAGVAAYPAIAILGFLVFSRAVVGQWFVASGFFVPENAALHNPAAAFSQIIWGVRTLSGYPLAILAAAGLAWLAIRALVNRHESVSALTLSLCTTAALPWWAFLHGHPYRIRYMVPLLAAEAIGAGVLVGELVERARLRHAAALAASVLVVTLVAWEQPPLDARAAMVVEAQWDRPNVAVRQQLTGCLRTAYRGETIMASMGSLGHYMQEMAAAGFSVRDFLHEGNGDIWLRALERPRLFVGWILIEEKAEGGDMLAAIARENPHFLDGFSRVCSGSGIALYQRQNRMLTVAR
jgi:hypothetical protein